MTFWLILWFATLAALLAFPVGSNQRAGAFILTYFLGMSLIHVPGALLYAGDNATLAEAAETTRGFELTVVGFMAFVMGAALQKRLAPDRLWPLATLPSLSAAQSTNLNTVSWVMIIIGALTHFAAGPIISAIPSLTAASEPISSLMLLGLWLQLYVSLSPRARGTNRQAALGLGMASVLPIATLATQGIVNYGTAWFIGVISFVITLLKRRTAIYVAAPFVAVFALSLAVTYLAGRGTLRDFIWEQQSTLAQRVERIGDTFAKFHIVDFDDPEDRNDIDLRLNQNYFVGAAMKRHDDGYWSYAYGGTVAPWALIPRAIWPDKPAVGGGRTVVTNATGIPLSATSSFGAGQVLEFYVNFGVPGVIFGFFGFGYLLMRLDLGLMRAFRDGDVGKMLLYGLPGFSLIQWEGNLLEIMVSTVSAILIAMFASSLLRRYQGSNAAASLRLARPRLKN